MAHFFTRRFSVWQQILVIAVLAIVVSLIVRAPHLTRALGIHGENASSHVLITLKSYEQNPVNEHYFLPIYQYAGAPNADINNMPPASLKTEHGHHIYVSFPALGYFIPYVFLKTFSLPINEYGLRSFNLTLHLVFGFLLFVMLRRVVPKASEKQVAIATVVVFFAPEVMWSFSNAYWMHSPAQIFFLGALIFWHSYKTNETTGTLIGLLALLTLTALTEWFGYVLISGVFLWELIETRGRKITTIQLTASLSAVLALSLTFLHFSCLLNVQEVLQVLTSRASVRAQSGLDSTVDVFKAYGLGYGLLLLFPVFAMPHLERSQRGLLFVASFPIIENFLLQSHTKFYTYATLKLAVPLGITALVVFTVRRTDNIRIASATIISGLALFLFVNSPFWGPYFEKIYREPGTVIKSFADDKDLLFTNRLLGHIVYYSGRNIIFTCHEITCMKENMRQRDLDKGWYFVMQNRGLEGFDLIKLPYFYGFHNGVIESAIKISMTDPLFSPARTMSNISNSDYQSGVSERRDRLIFSKSTPGLDDFVINAKQIQTSDGKMCSVASNTIERKHIVLHLADTCTLSLALLQYPALVEIK